MNLDRNDVVTLTVGSSKITDGKTFAVCEFKAVINAFVKQKTNTPPQEWTQDGVECLILQPGSNGWVKGKVRISLEFIPEEAEEELEEEISTSVAVIEDYPSGSTEAVLHG